MQRPENPLRQRLTDSGDTCKLLHPGLSYTLDSAEVSQQGASSAGTHTRNVFKDGMDDRFLPAPPMTCNGETMRLIPDLLRQVRCG